MSYPGAVETVLAATLAVVAADLLARLVFKRGRDTGERPATSMLLRWLRIVVNATGMVALVLVTWTALSGLLTDEKGLTGGRLIWHVTVAPAFAVAAVGVALFWAHRNRFSPGHWGHVTSTRWAMPLRKLFFWLAVALSIPTFVSILAAMFPIADTEGQQTLIRIHRYCGPLLAAAGLLFAYFALAAWLEGSSD